MSALPNTVAWDDFDQDDIDEGLSQVDATELDTPPADIQPELADRMLRRVVRERRLLDQDRATAEAHKARLLALIQPQLDHFDEWLLERTEAHDTSYLEQCLQGYHEALLVADPKRKTIHLPSGTLVARKGQPAWEFDDEAFIAWAKEHRPDLVRTKEEIEKVATKKALIAQDDGRVLDFDSGEFITSVTVTPAETTFTIKPSDEDGA